MGWVIVVLICVLEPAGVCRVVPDLVQYRARELCEINRGAFAKGVARGYAKHGFTVKSLKSVCVQRHEI